MSPGQVNAVTQANPTITQGTPAPAPTPQVVIDGRPLVGPRANLLAQRAARDELRSQRDNIAQDRKAIADRLRAGDAAKGADLAGLEKRITTLDEQILAIEKQIALADAEVAKAAGVPGATIEPPFRNNSGDIGESAVAALFVVVVLLPLSIAFARRIWRRGSAVMTSIPRELAERLTRIEEAVDTMAIEVERIGEGQRFVTHLFVENGPPNALGAGAMEPVEVRERERVRRD